ncbi:MAG: hypothetical protein Q8Q42_04170 [Nanoarchaeota archaeon]|nr:hypothetical protein [Nanoarchaeota archaeon]
MNGKYLLYVFVVLVLASIASAAVCEEGDTKSCGEFDEGECHLGVQFCNDGNWGFCVGQKLPEQEVCDDNKDNDCDGDVDEGCDCDIGDTRKCGPQNETGICAFGVESCNSVGFWSGECDGAVFPDVEKCGSQGTGNLLDDDCDGLVDEDCYIPTADYNQTEIACSNRYKDIDEDGIDCGGSCRACNDCSDGVLELDEEDINVVLEDGIVSDCGGLNCPRCPTCSDNVENQGEEGIDCGGPCPVSCIDISMTDLDGDGLTLSAEVLKGTDPSKYDTDGDGYNDMDDEFPLCPNNFCDELRGENKKNCPEDCSTHTGYNVLIVLSILVILVAAIILFFYSQYKASAKNVKVKSPWAGFGNEHPESTITKVNQYSRVSTGRTKTKQTETEAEKKLRESLEKIKK